MEKLNAIQEWERHVRRRRKVTSEAKEKIDGTGH